MLGNLHVRFGEGDGETCLRKGIKRFISTLPPCSFLRSRVGGAVAEKEALYPQPEH